MAARRAGGAAKIDRGNVIVDWGDETLYVLLAA